MSGTMSRAVAAYGGLGLPLAMVALPVYVQVPAYYAGPVGLPLATVGAVVVVARLADALPDPWLGRWVDHLAHRGRLRPAMAVAAAVLAAGFAALWRPAAGPLAATAWLLASLVVVSVAHTFLQVAHLAWGARVGDGLARVQAAAWREGFGLAGVLLASALPPWLLARAGDRMPAGYPLLFAALLAAGVVWLWRGAPSWQGERQAAPPRWRDAWAQPGFRALLPACAVNALAVALPATLVLFFVRDRLGLPDTAAVFLALYFAAAAAGLPLWTRLATRLGPARAWRTGMLSAAAVFGWAALLGPGDAVAFAVVCGASGLLLGADLALPPVLLAARIPAHHAPASYYGVWTLLGKLAIAGAGLALPLLALCGYVPGSTAADAGAGTALAVAYAGVPCALKCLAAALLPRDPGGVPRAPTAA